MLALRMLMTSARSEKDAMISATSICLEAQNIFHESTHTRQGDQQGDCCVRDPIHVRYRVRTRFPKPLTLVDEEMNGLAPRYAHELIARGHVGPQSGTSAFEGVKRFSERVRDGGMQDALDGFDQHRMACRHAHHRVSHLREAHNGRES